MSLDSERILRSVDFALEEGQLVLGAIIDSQTMAARELRAVANTDLLLANLAIALANADRIEAGEEEEIDFDTARDALLLSWQLEKYGQEEPIID